MHRNNIIHRDMKLDYILSLESKNLKVCISDLGLACRTDDKERCFLKRGTPGCVALEALKNKPFKTKSDIFSVECIFFNILSGKIMFQGKSTIEMLLANYTLKSFRFNLHVRERFQQRMQGSPAVNSSYQCGLSAYCRGVP